MNGDNLFLQLDCMSIVGVSFQMIGNLNFSLNLRHRQKNSSSPKENIVLQKKIIILWLEFGPFPLHFACVIDSPAQSYRQHDSKSTKPLNQPKKLGQANCCNFYLQLPHSRTKKLAYRACMELLSYYVKDNFFNC